MNGLCALVLASCVATVVAVDKGVDCKKDCPVVGHNSLTPGGGEGTGDYTYVSHGGIPVISKAKVTFTTADLGTGSEPSSGVRNYVHSLGESDDDAGHIYANRLGGKAVPINIFPQNKHLNRGDYEHFERSIYDCFHTSGATKATLEWHFTYAKKTATRPTKVSYSAKFNKGCKPLHQSFDNLPNKDGEDVVMM